MTSSGECLKGTACLELVLFMAAGMRFAVDAAQIRSSTPDPGNNSGTVESVLALDPPPNHPPSQLITVKGEYQDTVLTAGIPVELCSFHPDSLHPLPEAIRARCRIRGIRALVRADCGFIPVVDLRRAIETSKVVE